MPQGDGTNQLQLQQYGGICPHGTGFVQWNQPGLQGPTGPTGPQGPQGYTGAQGATGPAGDIDFPTVTTIVDKRTSTDFATDASDYGPSASCPKDSILLGAGWSLSYNRKTSLTEAIGGDFGLHVKGNGSTASYVSRIEFGIQRTGTQEDIGGSVSGSYSELMYAQCMSFPFNWEGGYWNQDWSDSSGSIVNDPIDGFELRPINVSTGLNFPRAEHRGESR